MLKKISIVTLIMVVSTSFLFAHDITGRDIVTRGESITIIGTLKYESSEWYLATEDGIYQLHFGNRDYLSSTGIELKDGKECTVEGFVYGKDIAVSKATLEGKIYAFRDKDGVPLWAGRGARERKNMTEIF